MPSRTSRKTPVSATGEFGLIERIKKQIGVSRAVVRGIGDDAAVLNLSSGKCLLFTADMLTEGVHFGKTSSARRIGHKAIAASISDIAAMGGEAKNAVISLGIPQSCRVGFVLELYRGIKSTAKKYGVNVVGGDTVKSSKIIISVAMIGEAGKNRVIYRKGAKAGDQIFVTGRLGKSLASGRHLKFAPRVEQARYLVKYYRPSAMIDISDGLVADLGHILDESRVGALLEEKELPARPNARLDNILYDGEDFELLFTLPKSKARRLIQNKTAKFNFYPIGVVTPARQGLRLRTKNGYLRKLNAKGYTHF